MKRANSINQLLSHREDRILKVDSLMGNKVTDTFALSLTCIEGYLSKEIDTKGVLRRTKRHLRYARIIFSSGKFCIKADKQDT